MRSTTWNSAGRLIDGITPSYDMHVAAALAARAAVIEITDGCRAALPMYSDAAARLRALGHLRELAFSLLGQGRCLVDLGEPGAGIVLTEARDLFASFGFRQRVDEAESLLSPGHGSTRIPVKQRRVTGHQDALAGLVVEVHDPLRHPLPAELGRPGAAGVADSCRRS